MFDDEWLYDKIYSQATEATDLPWHRETLPPLLEAFLANETDTLSILDLGTGAGIIATQLAADGHDVTGIDYQERAVQMASERASKKGVDVEFVHANALEWDPGEPFDIVIDLGLLHGLPAKKIDRFSGRLPTWIRDEGDFFLSHFTPRHRLDWRPVGPNRRRREEVMEYVPSTLTLKTYAEETVHPALPVGPTARFGHYWFSKS